MSLYRLRIGTTIQMTKPLLVNDEAVSLEGVDLSVFLVDPRGTKSKMPYVVSGVNDIVVVSQGKDQVHTGLYRLEIYANYKNINMAAYDCPAFVLVPHTEMENDNVGDLNTCEIDMSPGNLIIGAKDGENPYIGENGNWWVGDEDTGVKADYSEHYEQISQAEAARQAAEEARETAEAGRVSAEQTREANEVARQNAETLRKNAENMRSSAENTRLQNEWIRSNSETLRESNENTRKGNEQARQASEQERIGSENARETAESNRVANEVARDDAESERSLAEYGRTQAEIARNNNEAIRTAAETNRAASESSRQSAESSRASAESLRVSAENARIAAEAQREQGETNRNSAYTTAEAARQTAYQTAEDARDTAFDSKESERDAAVAAAAAAADTLAAHEAGLEDAKSRLDAVELAVRDLEELFGESVEGYVRVAGASDPDFKFREFKHTKVGEESVFDCIKPCLVGNNFTGNTGKILHILQTLDWTKDVEGHARKIDGSEGEVLICNTKTMYAIVGVVTVNSVRYDCCLYALIPFEWNGHKAEEVKPTGISPHYCVSHTDSDNVTRMHSVLNMEWQGSHTAPYDVVGKFVATDDGEGNIVETFEQSAYVIGDAHGKATTNLALYTGEQYAMNLNDDPTKTVPYYNSHAWAIEVLHAALMIAEGGTFYLHAANSMGSGFCANVNATEAAHWDESHGDARNGFRYKNASDQWVYAGIAASVDFGHGRTGDNLRACVALSNWRTPWNIMEQQRVLCHAAAKGIGELTWFAFEGNIYKYRSVPNMAGLSDGAMTAVVWKKVASTLGPGSVQPSTSTDISGNRCEWMVSSCVYRGVITDVSPSWWMSGLWMCQWGTDNTMHAYLCKEQAKMIKSSQYSTVDEDVVLLHEEADGYHPLPTINAVNGYQKDHCDETFMWPASVAMQTGAGLGTYNAQYKYLAGTRPAEGKKLPRGFRRGNYAVISNLSPLYVSGYIAPSYAASLIAFGICCELVSQS